MHEPNAPQTTEKAAAPCGTSPIAPVPLRRPLLVATASVACAGLAAELAEYLLDVPEPLVERFSLSYEANLPTWYITVLLFACSERLAALARVAPERRRSWAAFAGIFAYLSLDEAIQIHEHLALFVPPMRGVLHFGWVIPGALLTLALGLAFAPFLASLSPSTRRRFVFSAALYVGGALLMELPLGWWADTNGDDNLGYGIIDWVEESMELAGATTFLLALEAERKRVRA